MTELLPTGTDATVIEYVPAARRRAEMLIGAYLATYSNELTRRNRRQSLKKFLAFLDSLGVQDPISEVRRGHIDTGTSSRRTTRWPTRR